MPIAAKKSIDLKPVDVVEAVSKYVSDIAGIQLGLRQRAMVETRLSKRMMRLEIEGLEEYWSYFQRHPDEETKVLVSILTTHHTYFFREFAHFEFIENEAIPALVDTVAKRPDKTLRVWCAASSTGQEVYSLSMFLNSVLRRIAPHISYKILGTDVDAESVRAGKNGVYQYREIKEIPLTYVSNNWLRGTGEIVDFVKAKPSIKAPCRFETLNLLNFGSQLNGEMFDIIFCRNVFIYFTQEQIKSIASNLLKHLTPEGYFFTGISESLNGLNLPLDVKGPSVYSLTPKEKKAVSLVKERGAAKPVPTPSLFRVLCVDDSPSILTLMKQILTKSEGFEVVGTAVNGLEARNFLEKNSVDLVTLDIHMPVENGIEYLQKNFSPKHPAVVVISSVARENADLALKALTLGAADYVEKPALNNLKERGDEIRVKLRCAYRGRQTRDQQMLSLDHSFEKSFEIKNAENKIRLVVANFSDIKKIDFLLNDLKGPQPATIILVEGATDALPELAKAFGSCAKKRIQFVPAVTQKLAKDGVYIAEFTKSFESLKNVYNNCPASICVVGELSVAAAKSISGWKNVQLLLEDSSASGNANALIANASDVFPATSFAYISSEYLSKKT